MKKDTPKWLSEGNNRQMNANAPNGEEITMFISNFAVLTLLKQIIKKEKGVIESWEK